MNRMLNNYKFNEFLQATTYAEKVTCSEHTSKYLRVTATHVEDITPTFSVYRPPGTTCSREAIVAQRKVVATKSSSHFRAITTLDTRTQQKSVQRSNDSQFREIDVKHQVSYASLVACPPCVQLFGS